MSRGDSAESSRPAKSPLLMMVAPSLRVRSEEHTSELQSQSNLVCRLLLEKKKNIPHQTPHPAAKHNTHTRGHSGRVNPQSALYGSTIWSCTLYTLCHRSS